MDVIWILIGVLAGWIGYSYLNLNEKRGPLVSLIIGALGGFVGGKVVAPMFTVGALTPGDFSEPALLFAAVVAAAFLGAANLVYSRWGV